MYKDADAEVYDYFPPASYDLQVAECEGGHKITKMWEAVRDLEENMGRSEEEVISDREDQSTDSIVENEDLSSDSDTD